MSKLLLAVAFSLRVMLCYKSHVLGVNNGLVIIPQLERWWFKAVEEEEGGCSILQTCDGFKNKINQGTVDVFYPLTSSACSSLLRETCG